MKKFYGCVCKGEVYISAFCFLSSCIIIFVAAVARSFDNPLNWSVEISLFLFAWSVFLSADAALRADKLVSVDILVGRFSRGRRDLLFLVNYTIILVFLAALLVYGIRLSYITRARAFQGIPGFSYTWITLSIPVGALLQIVTVSIKLRAGFKRLAG